MLDKYRQQRRKRELPPDAKEIPLLDLEPARKLLKSATDKLPEIGGRINPWLNKAREKVGDAYSSVAQVIATKKEEIEDKLAERKNRARAPQEE